jgi:hypothetical protein
MREEMRCLLNASADEKEHRGIKMNHKWGLLKGQCIGWRPRRSSLNKSLKNTSISRHRITQRVKTEPSGPRKRLGPSGALEVGELVDGTVVVTVTSETWSCSITDGERNAKSESRIAVK